MDCPLHDRLPLLQEVTRLRLVARGTKILMVLNAVRLLVCFYNVMKMLIRGIKGVKEPVVKIPDMVLVF